MQQERMPVSYRVICIKRILCFHIIYHSVPAYTIMSITCFAMGDWGDPWRYRDFITEQAMEAAVNMPDASGWAIY